jgi:long-chain acyl-CoA synthetase
MFTGGEHMNWITGRLYDESGLLVYDPQNRPNIQLIKEHMGSLKWLPIVSHTPWQGLKSALLALDAGIPFMFLEPGEMPSKFTEAIDGAIERHGVEKIDFFSRTSGSSGRVKIMPRTMTSWLESFEAHREAFDLNQTTNWLIPGLTGFSATVYHALLGLYLGKNVYLQASLSPKTSLSLISQYAIDTLMTVPTRLSIIVKVGSRQHCEEKLTLDPDKYNLHHMISSIEPAQLFSHLDAHEGLPGLCGLTRIVTVGEVLLPSIIKLVLASAPLAKCYHYYGASELGQVAYSGYEGILRTPDLLGQPFKNVTISINSDGDIVVNSPYTALDFPSPATVNDKGRWDGHNLYFAGRVDLQFNRHGRNISLDPLRDYLAQLQDVTAFWIERVGLDGYNLHLLMETAHGQDVCERLERTSSPENTDNVLKEIQHQARQLLAPLEIIQYKEAAYTTGGKLFWYGMQPL